MVETNTLIGLLRFVALVAPVIAITMQVLSDRRDDLRESGLPGEFRALQWSLIILIVGGLIIGMKLSVRIKDPLVLLGIALVFSSLPVLAFSVWWSHQQISVGPSQEEDVRQHAFRQLSVGSRYLSVVLTSGILIGGIWILSRQMVEQYFTWGIFLDSGSLSPGLVFAAELFILGIGGIDTTFQAIRSGGDVDLGPLKHWGDAIWHAIVNQVILLVFYLALVGPVFAIGAISIFILGAQPTTSVLWNLPLLWSILVTLFVLTLSRDMQEECTDAEQAQLSSF